MQLHWWLRGYGSRVEVLVPESLRTEFAEMVKASPDAMGVIAAAPDIWRL